MKIFHLFILLLAVANLFGQNQLKINAAHVKVVGNVHIVLNDTKWVNDGTFTDNSGTVHLKGSATATNSSIEGTNATTFHNLTIDKSANNAQLGQPVTVSNVTTLQSGNLDLKKP